MGIEPTRPHSHEVSPILKIGPTTRSGRSTSSPRLMTYDRLDSRLLEAALQEILFIETNQVPDLVHQGDSNLFDQLVRTLPDGVYLTSIKQNDRKVQLKGIAQSSSRVSNYMRNIDASEWMADPSLDILETKGGAASGSDFTLNATQENPNLKAAADGASGGAAQGAH